MRAEDWAGQRVAVWGAARSGIAAANLLAELGAEVVLSDSRPTEALALPGLDGRVAVEGGGNVLAGASILVPSPGLRPSLPGMEAARRQGVRLVSEVELAAGLCPAPLVAVTGTDGKSTTTLMCAAVLRACGLSVAAGGNLGPPLSEVIATVGADGVLVAEISEFQLWSCGWLRPRVAVITNVADDHADYFDGDHGRLAASMARILQDQGPGDTAVLRAEDPVVQGFLSPPGVARVAFGPQPRAVGLGLAEGWLTLDGAPLMVARDLALQGPHNVANAQAALAVGLALGLPVTPMAAALTRFEGLPHRLQRVRERGGVVWYDDSKATNAHAAAVGLRALEGPLVVIAGGYDKGLDLQALGTLLIERARHVVVTGPTGDRLAALLAGRLPVHPAESLEAAVVQAASLARPGDRVVLSPAASSFDAFTSYAHRGEVYQAAVRALP